MIFHLKMSPTFNISFCNNIQSIIFFSHLLTSAETRYWPTKVEMARLVWKFQKTRHLVEVIKTSTIVYINLGVSLRIAK